jgi:hypothetical protein
LWTSIRDGRWRVRWVQWCLDEQFFDAHFDVWLLHPRPDAQVYAIDSYHDLEGLEAKFPSASASPRAPDWTAVADAYDGVHLSEAAQWSTRHSRPLNLYGWVGESTCWFHWVFDEVTRYGAWRPG